MFLIYYLIIDLLPERAIGVGDDDARAFDRTTSGSVGGRFRGGRERERERERGCGALTASFAPICLPDIKATTVQYFVHETFIECLSRVRDRRPISLRIEA